MRPLGTYSFLPWLRSGLAGQITAADHDAGVHGRATVRVELEVSGQPREGSTTLTAPVQRDVALYGPGDVVGVDARAIVRCEPRDWITNFEPNYLPHVEFYDEDFPWRYTPAAPDASQLKLRPWIALVALEDGVEFRGPFSRPGAPLPFVEVTGADKLPDGNDLWAWAHAHVNTTLASSDAEFVSTDMPAVMGRLQSALAANRDLAYSRIVCPRRLRENTAYRAFVVPVFETGRLAGLGLDPGLAPSATTSAWAAYAGKLDASALPVYHHWYFRTGGRGDFEYLVRLLKPGVADKRVGVRDMDVRRPSPNLPGIDDEDLGGILKLGGALRFPRDAYTPEERAAFDRFDKWAQRPPAPRDYPQPFQQKLAALVSLPDDYAQTTAAAANTAADLGLEIEGHSDPLITAPLYGRWHALTQRLLVQRDGTPLDPDDNWVHELNLDPRHRVAAGFGTRVVQTNQETYMQAAWEQIGDVLAANRKIRLAQLAKFAAASLYTRALVNPRVPERALALTAPAHAHIVATGATVRHRLGTSRIAPALTSVAMRRVVRPGGRLVRNLPFTAEVTPGNLLGRVDAGAVSAAPPKETPPGVVTVDEVGDATRPPDPPRPWIVRLLPWLAGLVRWLVRVLTLLAGIARRIGLHRVAVLLLAAAKWLQRAIGIAPVKPWIGEGETDVEALPRSPDFVISRPGAGVTATTGERDSVQAQRFKTALADWYALYEASRATGDETPPAKLDVDAMVALTVPALDPHVTVPKRTLHAINLPPHIRADLVEDFGEVMAYPVIDQPMYEPLKGISDELFLPNLNLIKPNSISLLETNQKFIEAYMVGTNHEIARELLWREYPH